jgi:hypothetical protein
MREHLKDYIENSKTPSVRGLRILLEYFYALEVFQPIIGTKLKVVSVFGSARTKSKAHDYILAKKLGAKLYENGYAVLTGASQGIMQAANEGVSEGIIGKLKKSKSFKNKSNEEILKSKNYINELNKFSAGLKITLPFEPENNPFVGVAATFHYFMVRKFFFGSLSSAYIACEGGWGTRDELYEMLTLVQTGKTTLMPIIYITRDKDHIMADFNYTLENGYISPHDMKLIDVVSDYKQAIKIINDFYKVVDKIEYAKNGRIKISLACTLTAKLMNDLEKLIEKKYHQIFQQISFNKKKILLKTFSHNSYGYLREFIDFISKRVK